MTHPDNGTSREAPRRMPRYPEPITPADEHPTGCLGCELDDGPHVWTPPIAGPPSEWPPVEVIHRRFERRFPGMHRPVAMKPSRRKVGWR